MTSNRALAILYRLAALAALADDLIQADDPGAIQTTTDRVRRALRDLDAAAPGWRERTPRGADAARGGSGELGSPWAVVDTSTGRIVGRWRTRELAEARLRPGQAIRGPDTGETTEPSAAVAAFGEDQVTVRCRRFSTIQAAADVLAAHGWTPHRYKSGKLRIDIEGSRYHPEWVVTGYRQEAA